MTPKINRGGVNAATIQGAASTGDGAIKRQISLDDALAKISDLVDTGVNVYTGINGKPIRPAAVAAPVAQPVDYKKWALIGGAALAVVLVLVFALKRR
jgi:hypothetical protein